MKSMDVKGIINYFTQQFYIFCYFPKLILRLIQSHAEHWNDFANSLITIHLYWILKFIVYQNGLRVSQLISHNRRFKVPRKKLPLLVFYSVLFSLCCIYTLKRFIAIVKLRKWFNASIVLEKLGWAFKKKENKTSFQYLQ